MHPTGAASLPAAPEAEVQAMHSMDWLFKKERIYLLAQFWQQVTTENKNNRTNNLRNTLSSAITSNRETVSYLHIMAIEKAVHPQNQLIVTH
ncbi:unnamed protein product [Euphydryas editha]|uniref:Uncharacterized protein n=1 Tax=Euphydryas editha TaxID=104508 RepID=A0AAU9U4P6_EUPED|nr:unnamed protein product [Euphydryas editha]